MAKSFLGSVINQEARYQARKALRSGARIAIAEGSKLNGLSKFLAGFQVFFLSAIAWTAPSFFIIQSSSERELIAFQGLFISILSVYLSVRYTKLYLSLLAEKKPEILLPELGDEKKAIDYALRLYKFGTKRALSLVWQGVFWSMLFFFFKESLDLLWGKIVLKIDDLSFFVFVLAGLLFRFWSENRYYHKVAVAELLSEVNLLELSKED